MASELLNLIGRAKRSGIGPDDLVQAIDDLHAVAGLLRRAYGTPASFDTSLPPYVLEGTTSKQLDVDLQGEQADRAPAAWVRVRNLGANPFKVILHTDGGPSGAITVPASPAPPQEFMLDVTSVTVVPTGGNPAEYQIISQ